MTHLALSEFEDCEDHKVPTQISFPPMLAISHGKNHVVRSVDDLVYVKADGNHSSLYFSDGKKYISTRNLSKLEDLLAQSSLIRISSSCLVNRCQVVKYITGAQQLVVLSNGKELEVSRRFQHSFRSHFTLL